MSFGYELYFADSSLMVGWLLDECSTSWNGSSDNVDCDAGLNKVCPGFNEYDAIERQVNQVHAS